MALEEQYIDVPFYGGVDEHTSETRVAPPRMLAATNVNHRTPGAVGRRDKFDRLTSAPITDAKTIIGMPNGPLAVFTASGEAYTVHPTTGVQTTQDALAQVPIHISSDRVLYNDRDSTCHSMAVIGDIALYTWHYGPGDYDIPFDGGLFTGEEFFSAQPQVMYMLKNLASNEVLIPPRELFSAVNPLFRSGDYVTANVVTATDGVEYFVVLLSYDENTLNNEIFQARNRDLWAVSLDVDGVVLDSTLVESDILLWDSHCSPDQDSTRPFVYYFASNSSDNAELQLTASGQGVVGVVAVGNGGALTVVPPVAAWPSATDSDYTVRDLVSVYHDFTNGRVFFAWLDTENYGADWDQQIHNMHVTSVDDQITEAWNTSPDTIWSLKNPNGLTGTYLSDAENTLLPYNPNATFHYARTEYVNTRFALTTMRGAWAKIAGSTDVTFLVHGVSPRLNWLEASMASLMPITPLTDAEYMLSKTGDWYGVKRVRIDTDGDTVGPKPSLNTIEPNVLMMTKPWTGADGVSRCVFSASPPVAFGFGPTREAQPKDNFEANTTLPSHVGGGVFAHVYGGEANQSAYFVGRIPDDPSEFIIPEATFLVDDAISASDIPTLWNGSMVHAHGEKYVACLPIRSSRIVLPDSQFEVTPGLVLGLPWYGRTNYPSSGASIAMDIGGEGFIPAAIVDDVVTVSSGALSYFDGVDMRDGAQLSMAPVYVWDADDYDPSNEINESSVVGSTFIFSDYKGNVHRSGEAIESGLFSPAALLVQPVQADPFVQANKASGYAKYPIAPLSLYKQKQRELDALTLFGVSNNLYTTQTAAISYFHKEPTTDNDSPFYMMSPLGDGDGRSFAMSSSSELQPEVTNAALFIVARRDRVFFIDAMNPNTIRFSKTVGARTTVEYNANLQVRIPESAGGATALGVMDDKVIVFTKDKTYYFAGEGPNNLGEGAFTDPRPIASSHGCINPASVISNHLGVFFESRRGLMLLDRNLSVSYVGADVETTLRAHTITTVIEDSVNSEIRWSCYPNAGLVSTRQIVLNMDSMAWSVWSALSADDGLSSVLSPVDSTFHQGREYILLSNGEIIVQSTSESYQSIQIETPWLGGGEGGGRMSNQRVKEMYVSGYIDRDTPIPTNPATLGFDLVVTLDYDYDNGTNITTRYSRTIRVAYADIAFGDTGSKLPFTVRVPAELQKCFIFNMTVTVGTPSDLSLELPPDDIVITDIGVVVATKGGGAKMSNNVPT